MKARYLVLLAMIACHVASADTTLVIEAAPAAEVAHVEPEDKVVEPAVVCACDACTGVDETEEGQ